VLVSAVLARIHDELRAVPGRVGRVVQAQGAAWAFRTCSPSELCIHRSFAALVRAPHEETALATAVYGTEPPRPAGNLTATPVPPRSTRVSAPGPPRHPAATLLAATPALFHSLHHPGPPGLPWPVLRALRRRGPRPGTRGPDPGHVPPPADHRPHQGQQHDHPAGRVQVDTVGDRPGREQASADHDPGQGLDELTLMVHPRIAGAHETRKLRIIPAERLLNLLQLALLVFWERHDPSREKTLRRARVRRCHLIYPFVF
jgi:hypothetical protein